MPPIENCPECGSKMEKGYVSVSSRIWWSKEKTSPLWRLGEEMLAGHKIWGGLGTSIETYRCQNCKLILFHYGEKENE